MTQHDLDDGADLRTLIDRAISGARAPDGVGPDAMVRARRLRTRRRAAVGITGLVAATAVTAVVLPALGGPSPQPPVADDPSPTFVSSTPPTRDPSVPPDADPSEQDAAGGWWDVPSTRMVVVLNALVPPGVTVAKVDTTLEGVPTGHGVPARGSLSGVLAGGAGRGTFQLLLHAPQIAPEDLPTPTTTMDADGDRVSTGYALPGETHAERTACHDYYDTCRPIRDAAGDVVGRVMTDTEGGTLVYEAFLLGPDGGALTFTVMNSTGEKPGYHEPTAATPPLTTAQLVALVEDPAWTSYVS